MRYFIHLVYDGTKYHGWQEQDNAIAVQETVNDVLITLLKKSVKCVGSGRTDTGVHALQQVAHVDVDDELDVTQWAYKMNALLPRDIAVKSIRAVRPEVHARFAATARSYEYHIHTQKDPFKIGKSHFFNRSLDVHLINEACTILSQWKDFESFSKVKTDVNHFDCDIAYAAWHYVDGNHLFRIRANRFLRGMVRAIVGTLLDIGEKKLSLSDFALVLERRDRRAAGRAVPPEGLFLTAVAYPEDIYL
ncbi:MAG: tRNA pseudouridine(38-40) synthase TruA [Bacteroidota bacterium]